MYQIWKTRTFSAASFTQKETARFPKSMKTGITEKTAWLYPGKSMEISGPYIFIPKAPG